MQITNPASFLPKVVLIASKSNVNANSLATTTLDYAAGISASNSFPLFGRITRNNGTLSLLVFTIRLNSNVLKAVAAASTLLLGATTDALIVPLNSVETPSVVSITGGYDVNVTTINGSSGGIDISIYGLQVS